MNNKTIRAVGAGLVVAVWAALVGFAWFGSRNDYSMTERAPLTQAPEVNMGAVMDGSFMEEFAEFAADQFPLRDEFRKVKSIFHYYGLGAKDNNGIYIADGFAAEQVYPLNSQSVLYATGRFNYIYETALKDKARGVYMVTVPDKSYYLAEPAGQLRADYDALYALMERQMPWATHIDVTGELKIEDYYFTDTHWRQERILPVAQKVCDAMGVTLGQFTANKVDKLFYGVYHSKAALPMEGESLYLMESDVLKNCTVSYMDINKTGKVYDMDKLESADLYELFLGGARSLIVIDNPAGQAGKELVVFRDSFGSSLTPLLVRDYSKITLVDVRYINLMTVQNMVNFEGADVLFVYSTLILNDSKLIRP